MMQLRAAGDKEKLASVLEQASPGLMEPLWPALGAVTADVTLAAGQLDPKFVGLAQQMRASIGSESQRTCRLAIVPKCGHALHLEAPEQVLQLLNLYG